MRKSTNNKPYDPSTAVLLIYTGGTIGMTEDPATGALKAIDFAYIEEHVPEVNNFSFHIDTYSFDQVIDSSEMGPTHWREMALTIRENYDKYSGFVILHGTDTMAYTASMLSFMLDGLCKPVLLTGSQLPIGKVRTDGKENLLTSIEIAAAKDPMGNPLLREVCIYFDNRLLRGNRCTKVSSDQFKAFDSPNYPCLAHAGIDIHYHPEVLMRNNYGEGDLRLHLDLDPNILVLSLFPGLPESMVASAFETPGLKAVVFRTFGSGNAPASEHFLKILRETTSQGIIIVNISQCFVGKVKMERYATGVTLLSAGVLSGHDMTVEAALAKLMHLLGSGKSSDEVKRLMGVNLRGEMTV